MKTKILNFSLLIIIFSSCASTKYLPSHNQIDINEYGSYIKLYGIEETGLIADGELIAIDSNHIIILTEYEKDCIGIPIKKVGYYTLRYAKPIIYGWSIPIFALSTLSHGVFLLLTAPVNLIGTIAVSVSGANAYKYTEENMTYEQLKMFARFPQGIPVGIKLKDIKQTKTVEKLENLD